MGEWQSADQMVKGSIPRSAEIFSIYLNDYLTYKVNNKNKNKNNNASNSLVFSRWPQTNMISISFLPVSWRLPLNSIYSGLTQSPGTAKCDLVR